MLGGIWVQTLTLQSDVPNWGSLSSIPFYVVRKSQNTKCHPAALPVPQPWKVILVCSRHPDKRLQLHFSTCLLINIKVSSLLSKSSDITPKKEAPPVCLESCALPMTPGVRWALPSSGVLQSVTLAKIK